MSDASNAQNLPSLLFGCARVWPERPMLRHCAKGSWQSLSWGEFARRTAACARFLQKLPVAPGIRVVMVSDNRPELLMAEVALMALGAIPVPTYTTNAVADHAHILRDSGAMIAIAGNRVLAGRLRAAAAQAAPLTHLLVIDDPGDGEIDLAPAFMAEQAPDDIIAAAAQISAENLACLIYTSGTSGPARGVMLPHRSILSNIAGVAEVVRRLELQDEVYLSFLPSSHSFEHTVGQFLLPAMGVEIVYATGIEHLADNMQTVRPTIMAVVPRILEVIRARILGQVARAGKMKQRLFYTAIAAGERRAASQLRVADRLLLPLLDRLVLAKIRHRFGGRLRILVSGGARLPPEVGRFYQAIGFTLLQGYGQTEAGPVISVNQPPHIRAETVGAPLLGVEVRIAEDGEILVRGDLVMQGYWNRPEATKAALRDGWLHTGDIGVIEPDGHLRITDRKKDLIVLSGGENISSAHVESILMAEPEILQAVVAGEGKTSLSALIVPAQDANEAVIREAVKRANARLGSVERVRRHHLVDAFTIENGLLTPTQKIRRALIIEHYKELLEPDL